MGKVETVLKMLNGRVYQGRLEHLEFRMTTGYIMAYEVEMRCMNSHLRLCIIIPSTKATDALGCETYQGWVFNEKSMPVAVKLLNNRRLRKLDEQELGILKLAFCVMPGDGARRLGFADLPRQLTRTDIPL